MRYSCTPAVERAFAAAAEWSTRAESAALEPPEVLLGLLAEPECRAALILARVNIDEAAILRRWPELEKVEAVDLARAEQLAVGVRQALAEAQSRLFEYPQPLELATEHVLLGLASSNHEVGQWLRQAGLEPVALEAEVHRLAGHQPGPLGWDDDALQMPEAAPTRAAAAGSGPSRPALTDGERSLAESDEKLPVGVLRIIDAAADRAAEGLRVVEDYVRFVLDDAHLSGLCKNLRHGLTKTLSSIPQAELCLARDSAADVGAAITGDGEQSRSDVQSVVAANFKRVEQALRSLEEYAKIDHPSAAIELEWLRYRVYTIERAVDITRTSLERLADARLYVLIDGGASEKQLANLVEQLVAAGVHILQLRDKTLADRELLARARLVRRLTAGSKTLFVMNDRADLAALAQADGVHVGQDELSVKDARAIVGVRALVGVSTHSLEQARAAVLAGANYIGVGPTFASATKQFAAYQGIELLTQVAAEIRLPSFAIGGIDETNVPQVLATGMSRIAVSGAVGKAEDPAGTVRCLLGRLGEAQVDK